MYVIKNNYNAACNFFQTFDLKTIINAFTYYLRVIDSKANLMVLPKGLHCLEHNLYQHFLFDRLEDMPFYGLGYA